MAVIYDHLGRPVETKRLTGEVAAPSLSGVRSLWDTTVASGLTPARLASLLRSAANGEARDYLTLAEEMEERDLHYRCEIGKRRLAVSSLPVRVESATDENDDLRLAEEVRALVRGPSFRGLLKDLLDAIGKGYSVCEIDWLRGSKWLPAAYHWRDPRFFTFDRESRSKIRLLDETDSFNGIELPAYKFIVHLPHLKAGIPLRGGLAMVAAWAYMCKGYTVKDWLAFAEVFGMPLRVGRYDAGASPRDIDVLRMAVANLGSDAAAVIPQSMMIEFVESAKTTGGQELFQKLADWLDGQVSKGILGQMATTQGTPGKLGNEEAQQEVRHDIRDDDAMQLSATVNRDLVRPFVDLNWGPRELYPEVVIQAREEDDLNLLATALEKLVPLGLRVEQSVVRDLFGLPDPGDGIDPALLLGAPAAQTAANRARALNALAGDEDYPPDLIAGRMADAGQQAVDGWIGQIEEMLAAAGSLEEFRDMLLTAFDDLPAEALGRVMAEGMLAAQAAGRFDAEEESGG